MRIWLKLLVTYEKEVLIHDEEERTITQTGWVQSAKYHENGKVEIELFSKPCTTLAWSEKQLHTTSTSRYNQIEK